MEVGNKNHSRDPVVVNVGPAMNHSRVLEDSHQKREGTVEAEMGETIAAHTHMAGQEE
ncbi:hypothetical protein Nepgr_029270 [Nepenthes gracilis]|uniref:Uncharacterized protein n=1 Tax=Nepenthes gracilis TaxID=150966 RepID=A0AAD3TDM8_NEPGR|nr:hypothetical protein Nepgr_029270 [Nepenthes gracilis]